MQESVARAVHWSAVNRPMKLAVVAALGLSLVSCAGEPKVNPTLAALAEDSFADAAGLSAKPDWASIREKQGNDLTDEIMRECPKCQRPQFHPAPAQGDPRTIIRDSANQIAGALIDVPSDAIAPVAREHAKLSQMGGQAPSKEQFEAVTKPDKLGRKDKERAAEALRWEQGAIYAVGVAQGQSGSNPGPYRTAVETHLGAADRLRTLLPDDEEPKAAPGYTIDYPEPTNAASSAQMVAALEKDTVDMWQATATAATTPEWRAQSVLAASAAAVASLPFS